MADNGISGLAVAAAGMGAFLVYAGIRDVPTIAGLREVIGGKTPTGRPQKTTTIPGEIGTGIGSVASMAASAVAVPLIAEARKHLGKRYVFGSVGPNTFDCSGLVVYCLRKVYDPKTPRFTTHTFAFWARSRGWVKIDRANVRAGDVVLKSGHMGIAISNRQMIHAPNVRTVVKIADIYKPDYMWSGWRKP